jgi:hypothetical protein
MARTMNSTQLRSYIDKVQYFPSLIIQQSPVVYQTANRDDRRTQMKSPDADFR